MADFLKEKLNEDLRAYLPIAQTIAYGSMRKPHGDRFVKDGVAQFSRATWGRFMKFSVAYFDPASPTNLDLVTSLVASGWKKSTAESIAREAESGNTTGKYKTFVKMFSYLIQHFMEKYDWDNETLLRGLRDSIDLADRAAEMAQLQEDPRSMISAAKVKRDIYQTLGETAHHAGFYPEKSAPEQPKLNIGELRVLIMQAPTAVDPHAHAIDAAGDDTGAGEIQAPAIR